MKYSYRLVHDGALTGNIATSGATHFDMEEFTADTTGNAWSAVAAMDDAFYGSTVLFWTDIPSAFDFGVYYDGSNAMGGQFEARHALTYDDAGGLKYLYSTNTIAVEYLIDQPPGTFVLVEPAQFLPDHLVGECLAMEHAGHVCQGEPAHVLRVLGGEAQTDGAAHGMADEEDRPARDLRHDHFQVAGIIFRIVELDIAAARTRPTP